MQSRLAATIAKRHNLLYSLIGAGDRTPPLLRPLAFATTTDRTSADPNDVSNVQTQEDNDHNVRPRATGKEQDGRKSLHRTYPTVESTEVNPQPANPIAQQKRRYSNAAAAAVSRGGEQLEEASCAGLDGTPWPSDDERREATERQKKEQEEDNKEYFKHHKASPLSEIEVADTRKPLTRATDGTADAEDFGGRDVVGFLPEQMDSTDEALERAARIWKERAMRGDPDFPPSKVLRALRGEHF